MQIPIELIESEGNVRVELGDLTGLAQDIDRRGLIQAITVAPRGEGYAVIDGHRRLQACKNLGEQEIEATIYTFMEEDSDRLATQYQANVNRKDLSAYEQMQVMLDLKSEGYNQENIAEELGVSKGEVSKGQKAAKLIGALPNADTAVELTADALFDLVDAASELVEGSDIAENALRAIVSGDASSVRNALGAAEREAKKASAMERLVPLLDELAASGITVLSERPNRATTIGNHSDNGLMISGDLASSEAWVLDHRKLDCHAIWLHEQWQGLELTEFCMKPMSHRGEGKAELKESSASEKRDKREEEKADRKAKKDAKQIRSDNVKALLTGKWAQKDAVSMMRTMLRLPADANRVGAKALGLDTSKSKYGDYPDYDTAVQEWVDTLPVSKQPYAAVLLFAAYAYVEDTYGAKDSGAIDLFERGE